MSITYHPSSPDGTRTAVIQCSVTGCTATATKTASASLVNFRPLFEAAGWSAVVAADLCPAHARVEVVQGGGGGAAGGRHSVADSIRVVELSREIRDARQLIPADILDGGDLVDGVRRLAAEHQRVTAAHTQAADARDLLQAQRDELADAMRNVIAERDAYLLQREDLNAEVVKLQRIASKAQGKHHRATQVIGEQARELDQLRGQIGPDPADFPYTRAVAERDRARAERDEAIAAVARLRKAGNDWRTAWEEVHAIIRAVRDALGVPAEVADEDVPTVARTMVENLDRAAKDLPPYSYREGFATPPLTIWSDNGGEAFIPHTEDRKLTNTDVEQITPEPQDGAAEVPDCDRCDKPHGGRWLVPGALVLTQDGKETHVCLECLRVLNGGKL